jgi:hypothetical protein
MTIEHASVAIVRARVGVGDAVFAEADRAAVGVEPDGMNHVIAYPGPDLATALLQQAGEQMKTTVVRHPKLNDIVEAWT